MTEVKVPKIKHEIYVLCKFCGKRIHKDHIGGVFNFEGKETWFCDKISCLIEFSEKTK
jgi:hypothetical protein